MKHIAFVIMMALLPVAAATAQKSSLNGTLSGVDEGVKVVVCEPRSGRLVPTDTVEVDSKGRFAIEHDGLSEPRFFGLILTVDRSPLLHVMLLPKEKVSMDLRYNMTSNTIDIVGVKGSQNMEVYRRFNNMMSAAVSDPAKQQTMAHDMEVLLRENSDVLMSAFLVTYFESVFEQYAGLYKQVRDALIVRYPDDQFVRHLDDKLRGAVVTGMEAPDIALADRDGVVRRLSDLHGKVVLIDFWASWCRPCRAENPNVVRLYHTYKDKGFDIYSVSLDNSREKWLQAIEQDGLVWPNHVSDLKGWNSAGGRQYGISSIPATVLVDRDGKVLARNLRGPELENKLKEIFAE